MPKGKPDGIDSETLREQTEQLERMKGAASELTEALKDANGEFDKVIQRESGQQYVTVEDLRDQAYSLVHWLKQADELLDGLLLKIDLLTIKAREAKSELNG